MVAGIMASNIAFVRVYVLLQYMCIVALFASPPTLCLVSTMIGTGFCTPQ